MMPLVKANLPPLLYEKVLTFQRAREYPTIASVIVRALEKLLSEPIPNHKEKPGSPRLQELEAQFNRLCRPTPAFLKPLIHEARGEDYV